ncbi:MAG: hypothetical protein QUS14_00950, partial [Pyrinomonadaceae bacterium]|nr:hypothetical protein [Pyrinomonadaceae bacterium]
MRQAAEHIGFHLPASVGAGDTPMDVFLNGVGLAVHVGPMALEFRGIHNTIHVADSFELGDVLFYLAGIQEHVEEIKKQTAGGSGK